MKRKTTYQEKHEAYSKKPIKMKPKGREILSNMEIFGSDFLNCARHPEFEVLEFFINYTRDNIDELLCLMMVEAVVHNQLDFLRHGVEVLKVPTNYLDSQCLIEACAAGHLEIVKYLIENTNADIYAQNEKSLQLACKNKNVQLIQYLVIDLNIDYKLPNNCAPEIMQIFKIREEKDLFSKNILSQKNGQLSKL